MTERNLPYNKHEKLEQTEIGLTPEERIALSVIQSATTPEDAVLHRRFTNIFSQIELYDRNMTLNTAINRLRSKYPSNIATVTRGNKVGALWWFEPK